jgi:hypothetical protein
MDDTDQRGTHPGRGTIQRMDNVAIVVDDLAAATAFLSNSDWSWRARRQSRAARWIASLGSRESDRTSR